MKKLVLIIISIISLSSYAANDLTQLCKQTEMVNFQHDVKKEINYNLKFIQNANEYEKELSSLANKQTLVSGLSQGLYLSSVTTLIGGWLKGLFVLNVGLHTLVTAGIVAGDIYVDLALLYAYFANTLSMEEDINSNQFLSDYKNITETEVSKMISEKGFTNLQDFYSYTLKTTDKMMSDLSNAYSDLDTPEEGFFTLGTADLKVIKNAHAHAIGQLTILNLKNKALKAISKSLTNSCSQK